MATNLAPLKAAIKLVADGVADGIKAAGEATSAAKLVDFQNLIPDILTLLPQIGDLSVNGLSSQDYATLLAELATDLAIPNSHIAGIVNASVKLLQDIVVVIVPDVEALVEAIKQAPPVLPAPAA